MRVVEATAEDDVTGVGKCEELSHRDRLR